MYADTFGSHWDTLLLFAGGCGSPANGRQGANMTYGNDDASARGCSAGRLRSRAGDGPEDTCWWSSCPASVGGTFDATSCGRASWDTVLYVASGVRQGATCNDDACGIQSSIRAVIPPGAGIHALYVDGYASNDFGSYAVAASRP